MNREQVARTNARRFARICPTPTDEVVMRLKLGTQVKLTDERIRQLDSRSAKQYRQWVGVVVGYRPGAECPFVEFDADEERRSDILQDVAPAYLIVLSV